MAGNWLPLTEYSSKYQVSISTLRRRIKADDIKYQFKDGRYLILDQPQEHRPSLMTMSPSLEKTPVVPPTPVKSNSPTSLENLSLNEPVEEPILAAANRLLSELKKAYSQILQEKEEQILHLKDEVADLKTLVRVLETENERLARRKSQFS
ncbi:MAG: hypothetical protein ACAH59_03080 [Pseudobdellovibrionaceae bacterium]